MELPQPYLLFLGDITEAAYAKTAFGLRDWRPDLCIGEYALPAATVATGLPRLTPAQAFARGARALVIGIAPVGGALRPEWTSAFVASMEAGLDIVSGMHGRLMHSRELAAAAGRYGRRLIDVRVPPDNIPAASGRKRTGRRLLTVGTDCGLGKKYTALALTQAFKDRGCNAHFRATGQTGILIAGGGIPIDAVVSDFIAGAAELLSPDADSEHWDIVEGQGSIFHPAYAGVSLGLLHGSQPDVIVLCHEEGRERIQGYAEYATPDLEEAIELHLVLGRRTNSRVRCAGVALNTAKLSPDAARARLSDLAARLEMPVADPIRRGDAFDELVAACLADPSSATHSKPSAAI